MKMHITKEIINMICDRDMAENLKKEARSRAKMLKCTIYVYYQPNWCNAKFSEEYKGKENLFFITENT